LVKVAVGINILVTGVIITHQIGPFFNGPFFHGSFFNSCLGDFHELLIIVLLQLHSGTPAGRGVTAAGRGRTGDRREQ
jgi:hypothetical protein